jgi:hypothetical protein
MPNLQIEQTPIHALRPQDRNARTHSKRQIRQIADSMRRFGFNNPILTDDNSQIIAGHGRLEAAKLLGMVTVPSIRLSHMSETEKRAYIVADNAIALKAGWDREILAIELQGLIDLGFEVELTGFEPAEIDLIMVTGRNLRANRLLQMINAPPPQKARPLVASAISGSSEPTGCFVEMPDLRKITKSCWGLIAPTWSSPILRITSLSMDMYPAWGALNIESLRWHPAR